MFDWIVLIGVLSILAFVGIGCRIEDGNSKKEGVED